MDGQADEVACSMSAWERMATLHDRPLTASRVPCRWVRRPWTRGTVRSDVTQICVSEADAWAHVSADCPLHVCSGFAALPSVSYVRRVCPETPIACERSVLGETALKPPRGVGPHPWAPHPTPGPAAPGGGASPPSPVPRVGAAKCRPRGAPSPPPLGLPSHSHEGSFSGDAIHAHRPGCRL